MSAYNDYYANLSKQYQHQNQFHKTPHQIAEEQRIQAYQAYISTKEGMEAVAELNTKFSEWFDVTYGIKKPEPSNEVKELKEIVSKMASQIENLSNQLK
jgi:flagellar motility protein MotE (MotC chaperone)